MAESERKTPCATTFAQPLDPVRGILASAFFRAEMQGHYCIRCALVSLLLSRITADREAPRVLNAATNVTAIDEILLRKFAMRCRVLDFFSPSGTER